MDTKQIEMKNFLIKLIILKIVIKLIICQQEILFNYKIKLEINLGLKFN